MDGELTLQYGPNAQNLQRAHFITLDIIRFLSERL